MTSRAWTAAVIAGTLVAWLQLSALPWSARIWAAALLVPLPALMIVQARMMNLAEPLPRTAAYISSIVSLWMLAALTLAAGALAGYSPAGIGLSGHLNVRTIVLALAVSAACIAVLFAFRFGGFRESTVLRELLPVTTSDRLIFIGVSATAGICEEIVFRGFLLSVLQASTGSTLLAVLLSSGAFGIVHAYQRPLGALRAALLGALLSIPILLDDSLYAAILAHTLVDIVSGLWLARYLVR